MMSTPREKIQQLREQSQQTEAAKSRETLGASLTSLSSTAPDLADPNQLDDIVTGYTDRFDRLQFLFLEQEAKEQFFRLVLEQNDKIIDQSAILDVMERAKKYKAVLHEKAAKTQATTQEIKSVAQTWFSLYNRLEEALLQLEANELSLNEKKSAHLEELTKQAALYKEDDPTVETLAKMDFPTKDLLVISNVENTIDTIQSQRLKIEESLRGLKERVDATKQTIKTNEEYRDKCEAEVAKLDQIIADLQQVNSQLSSEQKELVSKESSLTKLIAIWCNLTQIDDFKVVDDEVGFKFTEFPENHITMGVQGDKLVSLQCNGIDNTQLLRIENLAKKSKHPLSTAFEEVYKALISL